MRVGILGGGISGLACAYFLGTGAQVLEREARVGGLCRSFEKEGFRYDQGGHIIFSKDQEVLDLELRLLGENARQQFRRNVIWYKNRFVKYPFENGLSALDPEDIYDCLYHYLKNDSPPPANFGEWINFTFGQGIADRYLLPYNRKIWKIEPREMSMGWVERVPKPPLEDVLRSAVGIETEGYLHQLHFHYPRVGGFEALPQAFARHVAHVETAFEVKSIRRHAGLWLVSDGQREFQFEHLVSTIPLEILATCLGDVPGEIVRAIHALRYNQVFVAMIGIRGDYLDGKSAVYVPDPACLAHRLCFNTYFSPSMAPAGHSSLIAEITVRPGSDLDRCSDGEIVRQLMDWLARESFLKPADVCVTDLKRLRYGYPVYDLQYEANIRLVNQYFKERGLHLCGRFAEHLYINSDTCIRRAWDLARQLGASS